MKNKLLGHRGTLITVGVVAAIIAAFIIWRSVRHTPEPAVATARATIADIEATVLASGRLEASQMVSVGAQVSGQIQSLKVKLGDRVKTGDLIAEIDATMQENELRDARAALVGVQAQRSEQAAALKQAQLAFERQKSMLSEEATSRADYESAKAAFDSARARIAALDAQIEQNTAKFDTAQANLGYTKIRAPLDGTVVAILAKEGQTVNAIQSAPTIVKLANLDTMTVSAEISEADVIHVRPGQTAYFTILGNPRKRYYGKLRSIEPAPPSIQAEAGPGAAASGSSNGQSSAIYYNGLFEVPNKTGELRISMSAQVSIVLREAKGAIVIPSAALGRRDSDGNHIVMVVDKDGKIAPRRITIGINNNASAEVLTGLAVGEAVVVGEATAETPEEQMRGAHMMF